MTRKDSAGNIASLDPHRGRLSDTPAPETGVRDNPELSPLVVFGSIAVPVGWVLLSTYQLLGLPAGPFVLLTLFLGLLLPAVILVRRDATTDGRRLWRDCYRLPRPSLLAVPAVVAIPGLTGLVAHVAGVAEPLTTDLLLGLAINIVSSVLIVNLWEELAWTGFFQRRAMARWGLVPGSIATAVLFAAIHLPLAFDDADGAGEVLLNVGYLVFAAVGLRLLIAGFDVWSHRSLLTIALLHASFNAASGFVEPAHDVVRYVVTVSLGALVLVTPVRHACTGTHRPPTSTDEERHHNH